MFLRRLNLQLFNDGGEGGEGNEPKKVSMTQAEFDEKYDKAYGKGAKKALDEFKKSEEYQELIKLKEANATEGEKTKEKLAKMGEMEKELQSLRSENTSFKNRSKVKDLKESDQMDFVMFEINKMVDDKTDFDDAYEKFKKEKPQYFTSEEGEGEQNQNFRTSSKKQNGGGKKSDAEAFLDKRYKNSRYRR